MQLLDRDAMDRGLGVAKSLLARKQYEALRRANPHMRMVPTSTRLVAHGSHHMVPLLVKRRI